MEQKHNFIGQYKFDDFFNKTAAMLKFTWKDSLLLLALVLLPLSSLAALGFSRFFGLFGNFLDLLWQEEYNPENFPFGKLYSLILPITVWGSLLFLAYWLADLFINAAISLFVFNNIKGETMPLVQALAAVLNRYMGKLVLQSLLLALLGAGLLLAFGLLVGLAVLFVMLTGKGALTILILVLLYLAFFILIIWLFNRFAFGLSALVYEGTGPVESLKKSSQLVRGHWWRVWSFLLLAALILYFAASMVTGPIMGASILPFYARLFEDMMSGNDPSLETIRALFSYLPNMGIPILLVSLIHGALYYLLLPVFRSLFYIDLKVRHNELNPPAPAAPSGQGTAPADGGSSGHTAGPGAAE